MLWPIGLAGLLDLAMAIVLCVDFSREAADRGPAAQPGRTRTAKSGNMGGLILGLRRFSSRWWLPAVVGLLSFINTFTIVLSGPLSILYISAVLGKRSRWLLTAFLNALGATAGVALLVFMARRHGTDWIRDAFPSIFAGEIMTRTEGLMEQYGVGGSILISAMPIVLHPLVFVGIMSDMSSMSIVASVLLGRTIKYSIMAWLAIYARKGLRFFGVNVDLLNDKSC